MKEDTVSVKCAAKSTVKLLHGYRCSSARGQENQILCWGWILNVGEKLVGENLLGCKTSSYMYHIAFPVMTNLTYKY